MFPVKDMRVVFIIILRPDNFSRENPSDDDMTEKPRTIDETSFYRRYVGDMKVKKYFFL